MESITLGIKHGSSYLTTFIQQIDTEKFAWAPGIVPFSDWSFVCDASLDGPFVLVGT